MSQPHNTMHACVGSLGFRASTSLQEATIVKNGELGQALLDHDCLEEGYLYMQVKIEVFICKINFIFLKIVLDHTQTELGLILLQNSS